MSRLSLFSVLVAALCLAGCKGPDATKKVSAPNQDHLIQAALYVQQSSEYKALCFQAYNWARISLDIDKAQTKNSGPRCVIVDIDETVLDNSAYAGYQINSGTPYSKESWKRWSDKAAADTIPGALGFLKYADKNGYEIFYLSNRRADEVTATMKNLKAFGFPMVDTQHMYLRTDVSNKEPRRLKIQETHRIAMLIGDNLNDFAEVFEKEPTSNRNKITAENVAHLGMRYIVLPNPIYGAWDAAIFNYNYKLSEEEKLKVKRSMLKDF